MHHPCLGGVLSRRPAPRLAAVLALALIMAAVLGAVAAPASATSVSNTSVSTSTPAAGATGVTYKVGFKTTSGSLVSPTGEITLTAPAGTFTNAS